MSKVKHVLIFCDVKDIPQDTRKWYYVSSKERIVLQISDRIYRQMKSIQRKDVPKYSDRLCTDILNDNDSRWWPAKLVWDIIDKGAKI